MVIIGGGAAGIVAAITAARAADTVLICEKMPQLGKKILASGNGRCNLLNDDLSESRYKKSARELVRSVFSKFDKRDILGLFTELGLTTYSNNGRIFPVTNQAASVLKVLTMELERLSVPVELGFEVTRIAASKSGFMVRSRKGTTIECEKVIIAGGGRSYPALGSDGSSYLLAKQFGHTIVEPVPSAVPFLAKDRLCHILQGQKIFADVTGVIDGKRSGKVSGELLFTKYGLSGTSILDVSEEISVAINREHNKDVSLIVDMAPFLKEEELAEELKNRIQKKIGAEDLFAGILPNKFGPALKDMADTRDVGVIVKGLKERHFSITGTRGWNEAEFTSGGIAVDEVKENTLESKLQKGLYFAGEALDVGGKRGGYHLAWAWASGYVAGLPVEHR